MELANSLVLILLAVIAGWIMPLTNQLTPSGQPDMTSFTRHMLIMEKTISSLQTQVLSSNSQLATVQSELQTAQTELRNVIAELRVAETDIESLKNKLQKLPVSDEFTGLKAEVEGLKLNQQAIVNEINVTIRGSLNSTIDSNSGEIQMLKSQLLATVTQFNKTAEDLKTTNVNYNTIRSKQHSIEQDLTGTKAIVQSTSSEMKVVKSQISTMSHDLAGVRQQFSAFTTKTGSDIGSILSKQHSNEVNIASTKTALQTSVTDVSVLKSNVNTVTTSLNGIHQQIGKIQNQVVTFRVSQTSRNRFGLGTLKFDTIEFNLGGRYSSTTGIFTAPLHGTYTFWAHVQYVNVGTVMIYKGNQKLTQQSSVMTGHDNENGYGVTSVKTKITLNQGDKIHFASTTATISVGVVSSYGGSLLHTS